MLNALAGAAMSAADSDDLRSMVAAREQQSVASWPSQTSPPPQRVSYSAAED